MRRQMRHPAPGTLRRLVDDPAGVADADRAHVTGCAPCRSALAAVLADAADGARAPDGRVAAPAPRWRAALRSPVLAVAGVVTLLTGAGVAAATDRLQIFRTEQIAPVTVTRADLVELPELAAYGAVEVLEEPDLREVADAAAAEAATGLAVPRVGTLPRGVAGEPVFRVGDRVTAVFTFSAEKAAATAGAPLPPPPGLDGSSFRLVAGPGVAAVWPSEHGLPALVAARAVAPVAYSSGVPFAVARDHLLALPGLPEDVAAQLRGFAGDGTTLPLPVPAERMTSTATEVGGVPATLLTSRDGALAGVVWVEDGVVTAVAGSLTPDEVLAVARGLRGDR